MQKASKKMLLDFITDHREELIALTRAKVARRIAPKPTEIELESGVPLFLDRLSSALGLAPHSKSNGSVRSAAEHGAALLGLDYTVGQVVYDYGEICQAITELTASLDSPITTDEFQTLNRCLDDAIAEAVTEYTRLRDQKVAAGHREKSGIFSEDLRRRVTGARLAFSMIRSGRAPSAGSVAGVVAGNLQAVAALVNRSLVELRLESGQGPQRRIHVQELMAEVQVDASMEASHCGISLVVSPVDAAIDVEADPQILMGALANLLQNAFKYTRAGGSVTLKASAAAGRVRIDVEDQCGGFPPRRAEALGAALEQRGADRGDLGLGLLISRRGVEASGGRIRLRDVPGKGCVFTVDLPRMAPAVL
jgi:signal transduction histidine kinase